jgi:hypothetical protein
MNDYTDTMRDVQAALRKENADARRGQLLANLEQFDREHRQMQVEITNLRLQNAVACSPADARIIANEVMGVLTERVSWHTWLLRGVIAATVIEVIGGVTIAFILHGIKTS